VIVLSLDQNHNLSKPITQLGEKTFSATKTILAINTFKEKKKLKNTPFYRFSSSRKFHMSYAQSSWQM